MSDPVFDSARADLAALNQAGLRTLLEWLATPPAPRIADELVALRGHLAALAELSAPAAQRASALELLYMRSLATVDQVLPVLLDVSLPIPRKTRQLVRNAQDLLQTLATLLASSLGTGTAAERSPRHPPERILWRCLHALSRHLRISHLVTAPAGVGIWQQLHQTYAGAQRRGVADRIPAGESCSLQHIYFSANLIACAQPASFTPREIDFTAAYLERFAEHAESLPQDEALGRSDQHSLFWIDPHGDEPAIAWVRKPPPPDTPVLVISCEKLAGLLQRQLAALDAGLAPQRIGLPALAEQAAGHGTLRRLAGHWGNPAKRRFQRRRQNYRATLCSGLDNLWQLLQDGHAAEAETSSWMVTNESPDGYALMHVAGKTGQLAVGDVAAIRTESGSDWQICVLRWALSENPEHFELGLQILAPRAEPALLVLPADEGSRQLRVLILPKIPPLRPTRSLIVPADGLGTLAGHEHLHLLLETHNIEVREARVGELEEQTARIESYAIDSPGET